MTDINTPNVGVSHENDDVVVDDTEGGIVLLEENQHRDSALIMNVGEATMRVTTDGSAPTSTRGKPIPAGGSLVMSGPNCPIGPIKAIRQDDVDTAANASEVD